MAQHACQGESHWAKAYKGNEAALKELGEREEYCLDLTFMHALLGLGYEIGSDRELIVGSPALPPSRTAARFTDTPSDRPSRSASSCAMSSSVGPSEPVLPVSWVLILEKAWVAR